MRADVPLPTAIGLCRLHYRVVLADEGLRLVAVALFGVQQLPAGRSAILAYTMPIWSTLIAMFVLHEPLNRRKAIGLALGTLGMLVLLSDDIRNLLTALEMPGVSLSLLVVDDSRLARLDAASAAPAWPGHGRVAEALSLQPPSPAPPPTVPILTPTKAGRIMRQSALKAAEALAAAEAQLTELDAAAGDGDLGRWAGRSLAAKHEVQRRPDGLRKRESGFRQPARGATTNPQGPAQPDQGASGSAGSPR